MSKIGRNQPCPCGSGKKYKRCHGDPVLLSGKKTAVASRARSMLKEHEAQEQNRVERQGLGRPIISMDFNDHKMVAVGNTVHFSKKWAYFPDFLMDYLKSKLGEDWGNKEIEKSYEERHPLIQWYNQFCLFQSKLEKDDNGHYNADATGLSNCYLGLAYNLYLLDHNAELQSRYIERLKKPDQFQGAYFELIVASCMIRAGFDLELEDESDLSQKHCEFAARSQRTGKRYWVEAKMRSVSGSLGKTNADGQPATAKPTSRLSAHLSDALKKPAEEDRIVFIDVNADPMTQEDFAGDEPKVPKWMSAAEKQLADRERDLREGERAYVFVTNFCFHNALQETFLGHAVLVFGLGIDDFGKPRKYTLKEAWRVKQKHIDLFAIEDAMRSYPQIPSEFDGDLPPEAAGEPERIKIGKSYNFYDLGIEGEVNTATVFESEKKIYIGVTGKDGKCSILSEDMSDYELEVYRKFPDTYFGVVQPSVKKIDDPYEFFEWSLKTYLKSSKEKLLEFMNDAPDIESLQDLDQEDLALEYCERMTFAAMQEKAKL